MEWRTEAEIEKRGNATHALNRWVTLVVAAGSKRWRTGDKKKQVSVNKNNPPQQIPAWPRVTVVMLAYNRSAAVQESLHHLTTHLEYPFAQLDFLVVDNASTDGTAAMVKETFPQVRVLTNARNQGAPGWNTGFQQATGDFVLILDDDAYLTGTALQDAVQAAHLHNADLVSFTIHDPEGRSFNAHYNTGLLSFWGCAALVRREVLDALQGYDPQIFLWGNELEFTMRALDAGFCHLFLPDVVAIHLKPVPTHSTYDGRVHRLNTRHLAYIAAKLLQPAEAVPVLLRLGLRLGLTALRRPSAWPIFLDLVSGLRQGMRYRQPVRVSVSRCYATHFPEFINQLPYRLKHRRWTDFFATRTRFFPSSTASLRL